MSYVRRVGERRKRCSVYDERSGVCEMSNAKKLREALELVIEAFSTPPFHGNWPVNNAKLMALREARCVLDRTIVFHRHEGWEGDAQDCPVCRAHNAKTLAEKNELSCAAELDATHCELVTLRDALTDMTAERDALVATLLHYIDEGER